MRSCKLLVMVLMLVSLPFMAVAAEQGFARLTLTEGDVQIRIADTDDWVPAAVNTPLYEGDSIWTPAGSRTELQLQDGSVIRLDERSSLSILTVEDESLQFYLGMGRIYVRTGEKHHWDMQFDLTDSTVKIFDKSRLRIDITARGDEEISVFKGNVYVESYGNRTKVLKGEMLSVEDSRSEILPINAPDSWDKWNAKRDSRIARRNSSNNNLPEELVVYEEELSSSGEWIDVQEYGRVWRPLVSVETDWAPYRSGRWIWRGGDYVWIPYEPWGWAPYHYGRWSIITGFGWCWVPPLSGDVFWAPAFVGWISTPAYVGWVPLAPGEIYYGRGYYGRHSVNVINVTNVTVNQTTTIYRHAHIRNAVTVANRNAFISGTGSYKRLDAGNLSKGKITIGRPEPKANAKEILMPQIRKVPDSRLPPANVAKIRVRELTMRFPKVGRGVEIAPREEKHTPQTGDPARHEKPAKARANGVSAPAERKLPGAEQKKLPTGETPVGSRGTDGRAPDSGPAARQADTPAERRATGAERRDQPGESRLQGRNRPERAREPKETLRKAVPPQERKAKNVWKIQPKEEGQPIKEKNK